jgi:hypothetical protein
MGIAKKIEKFDLEVGGQTYQISRVTFPFREGVELEVEIDGELLRVSDRQLGESEAVRLLTAMIQKKLS